MWKGCQHEHDLTSRQQAGGDLFAEVAVDLQDAAHVTQFPAGARRIGVTVVAIETGIGHRWYRKLLPVQWISRRVLFFRRKQPWGFVADNPINIGRN